MATNVKLKRRLAKIEKKYDEIIGELLKKYRHKTMGELWGELDKVKEQMGKEINEINGHNMDA